MSAEKSFAEIERMLEHCAPGATIRRTNHFRQVTFGKIVFPTLPKHDMIEVGHIRKMARTLGILECAKKFLRL